MEFAEISLRTMRKWLVDRGFFDPRPIKQQNENIVEDQKNQIIIIYYPL